MQLSLENKKNLLEIKKKLAVCVAKSNGKTVIMRKNEGDEGHKYVSIEKDYKIPLFFNPFHTKEKQIATNKAILSFFDKKMGNLNYAK